MAAILQMSIDMQRAIKSIKTRPAASPRKSRAPAPVEDEDIDPYDLFPPITGVLEEWNRDRKQLLNREV